VLADLEEALCALCTDAGLRRRLQKDGGPALAAFALTPDERAALLSIPAAALDRYAGSLLGKRSDELAAALPLSVKVVPSLPSRYRRLLARAPARFEESVLGPGLREGLRLLPVLRAELDADEGEAPWAGDLLAVEALRAASRADRQERFTHVRHDLRPVLVDLRRGLIPTEVAAARLAVLCDGAGARFRAT